MTPEGLIKTDLRAPDNKRGFPYVKNVRRRQYEGFADPNSTDCLTNFVLHELSNNGLQRANKGTKVNSFSDLIQKRSDMYVKNKKYCKIKPTLVYIPPRCSGRTVSGGYPLSHIL